MKAMGKTTEIAKHQRNCDIDELRKQLAKFQQAEREFLSQREREKGNEHFKCQEDDEAYHCYTKSIILDPSNAKSFTNRASVLARLGRYEEALNDCNSAIDIDPSYTNALTKRDIIKQKLQRCQQGTAKSELKTRMMIEEVFEGGDEILEEVFTPGSIEFKNLIAHFFKYPNWTPRPRTKAMLSLEGQGQ
jgi:tetratricopeptide (TPR) repeat protein